MKQISLFSYIKLGGYMKIEIIDDNNIYIFINSCYMDHININSKEDIIDFIKSIIKKNRIKLKMKGFYKVIGHFNDKVGLFLDIYKLDDNLYSNSLDIKVILNMKETIYFKTTLYDIIPINTKIYYYDNNFYFDISNINNIYDIVEYGEFIYGDRIDNILNKSISI